MVQIAFNTFLDGVELTGLPVYVYDNSTKDLVAKDQSPCVMELQPNIQYMYWTYYIDVTGRYYQDGGTLTPSTPLTVQMNLRYMARPNSILTITVTPEGTGSYAKSSPSPRIGEDLYVTAIPSTGYQHSHMNRYGVHWTTANPGEFLELGLYEKIEVVFIEAASQYSDVTITVRGQGTTTPVAGRYVDVYTVGSDLLVTAYPASGYHYSHMNRNGVFAGTDNPAGILNLASIEVIEVVFVPLTGQYSDVTINIVGQGTSDPAAGHYTDRWLVGDSLLITAYPVSGWKYDHMDRNGIYAGTDNPGGILDLAAVEVIDVVFVEEITPPPVEISRLPLIAAGMGALALVGATLYLSNRKKKR